MAKNDKKKIGAFVANEDLALSEPKSQGFSFVIDPEGVSDAINKSEDTESRSPFLNSVLDQLQVYELTKSKADEKLPLRLSFEVDSINHNYAGVYRPNSNLLPDDLKKRIVGPAGDDLVCQIVQARSNHAALMSRPRDNRFDKGFDLVPHDDSKLPKDPDEMAALMLEVEKIKEFIWTCGSSKVKGEQEQPTFSQYIKMIVRDGLVHGRHATEFVYHSEDESKLIAFRAADGGTIYKTNIYSQQDESIRVEALKELERLYTQKAIRQAIDLTKYKKGDYIYCQVINGKPRQFFTSEEMVMHNAYPVTGVEFGGYPLTPIDQAIHAITTHINITQHNKLYFQYGRAARGMLIIKSRNIDDKKLQVLRAQFQQTINSVKHAHRMPAFGITPEDDITWHPIDNSSRDQEFSFLSDQNARVILGAFQMSPDELPGYSHLSRGSNTQALSESNNEYKLTASRDVGLRPMLTDLQDFINKNVMPRINKKIAKLFAFSFFGLDADTPDKEATRLQNEMATYATMNDVLDRVEKERLPKKVGGDVILNQSFWQTVQPYLTVGEIMENFFGKEGASKDPRYMYIRDPMWFQYQQMIQADVQMRMQTIIMQQQQQQQMAMQSQLPPPEGQEDQDPSAEQGQEQPQEENLQRSEQDFIGANAELIALKKKWGI